jgi:RHS repeat-associated protein
VRSNGGAWTANYILRDYLGSITHITDHAGALLQELSYDPWGRLRNSATQQLYAPGEEPELLLGRGYTGHEHLPWFGLINMNARLYDSVLGRFLSPDPYVQAPDFSQNYNRYMYALNNPLKYTDESGELAWFYWVGAAIVGGVTNLVANWDNVDGFWDGLSTFAVGAGAACGILATGGSSAGVTLAVGTTGGALVGANNNIVAQTGKNFEGFSRIDWGQVGASSAIGGVAGAAGTGAGYWASNTSFVVNGVSSPVLRSVIVSPIASGAGHVASGTTANLLAGQNMSEAFTHSFDGIGQSIAIGTAIGVSTTIAVSYANGVSPWSGERFIRQDGLGAKTADLNLQKLNDEYLKQNGINAEALKADYLGKSAKVAHWDLYIDKNSRSIYILPKNGQGIPIPTGEYLDIKR